MYAAGVPTVFLVLPKPPPLVTEKFTGVFYNAIEKRGKCFLFRKHWGKKKRTSLIYFDSQNTTSLLSLHVVETGISPGGILQISSIKLALKQLYNFCFLVLFYILPVMLKVLSFLYKIFPVLWQIESRSRCKASVYIMFTKCFDKKRIKDLW